MPKGNVTPTQNLMSRYRLAEKEFAQKYPDVGERTSADAIMTEFGVSETTAKGIRAAINTRNEVRDERRKKEPDYKRLTSLMNKYQKAVDRIKKG